MFSLSLAYDGDGGYAKRFFAGRTPSSSWQPGKLKQISLYNTWTKLSHWHKPMLFCFIEVASICVADPVSSVSDTVSSVLFAYIWECYWNLVLEQVNSYREI